MIFFILAASTAFAQILAFSGATDGALREPARFDMTPPVAVFCTIGVLVVLGAFMDQIWLGVILLLFAMKGVAPPEIAMRQVWAAATPFALIVLAALLLAVFVPWFATGFAGAM